MPLYEFRCPSGHDFEKFYRSIGTASVAEACPECGVVATRLMSTAGLVFKGSGFYITDYGKDGKKDERDAAATAKTAAETKAKAADDKKATASDAKPATGDAPAASAKPADAASSRPAETAPKPATPPAPVAKPAAPSKKAE